MWLTDYMFSFNFVFKKISAALCVPACSAFNIFGLLFVVVTSTCHAAESLAELPRLQSELITADAQAAIDRGLDFLAEQQLEEGAFGYRGYRRNVAVCGLAGMAFLANGSTPGRGPYGQQIDRCIDYLLEHTSDSGFIAAPSVTGRGPMYGHGFAVLFLCETYGMAMRDDLRPQLAQAIDLIVSTQNDEGGWRYQPRPQDADLSVTVCQVMALRAARNAGFAVPKETMDRSIEYVKACQNADGGFGYTRPSAKQTESSPSQFARSAAGVVALFNAGIYDGPEISNGLDYIAKFRPGTQQSNRTPFYFYGHYYAIQAMWHAKGERWQAWYPAIRDELVGRQQAEGSWPDAICPEYGTAMACIILQVPNNYLPILQR